MLMSSLAANAVTDTDSIAVDSTSVELKGVEIEARLQAASSGVSTFIPTKKQKESSFNATDLLFRMNIPELKIMPMSNKVKTIYGEPVSLFIDYLPANDADVEGMRPEDVKRVEFLQYPTDPRFQGAEYVVNFVMLKYEYGGYTKLSLSQFLPLQYTDFSPYSKFSYKKMTFDVMATLFDRRSHHYSNWSRGTYTLQDPDGRPVIKTRDTRSTDAHNVTVQAPVSFRAVYNGGNVFISNTVGFHYGNFPRNNNSGDISFGNESPDNYTYEQKRSNDVRHVAWDGFYYLSLPHDFTMSVVPMLGYQNMHVNSYYSTSFAPSAPIVNDSKEDMVEGSATVVLRRKIATKHSVSFRGKGIFTDDRVSYFGSSPYLNEFHYYHASGCLEYAYAYGKWNVKVDGGVAGEWNDINGHKVNDVYPFAHLNASYSPNEKNSINIYSQYAATSVGISYRSPNIEQSNEYLYITGDPNLKVSRHITSGLTYSLYLNKKLRLSAYGTYRRDYDRFMCVYTPYDDGRALLRRYANGNHFDCASVGGAVSYTIIPGKLDFSLDLSQVFYRTDGCYRQSYSPFSFSGYINWYVGNVTIYGFFQSETRSLNNWGEYIKAHDSYQIGSSYRLKGWKFTLAAVNFCQYHYCGTRSTLDVPLYSIVQGKERPWSKFNVALRVSYTFSYGKKVQQGNEVQTIGEGTSGRL